MPWFQDNQHEIKELLAPLALVSEELWVFGSALTKDSPNDLDILIIYKESIYKDMQTEVLKLESKTIKGLSFHFTKLLEEEFNGNYSFTNEVRKTRVLLWNKQEGWTI